MRIQETVMRPALRGGGWSNQTRVRDLREGEKTPDSAVVVDNDAPLADWKDVEMEAPQIFAGAPPSFTAAPAAAPVPPPAAQPAAA